MQLVQADNLKSIPQLLAQRADELDQKPFVIDGPITLSYQDMLYQAHAMGAFLWGILGFQYQIHPLEDHPPLRL